MDSPGKRCRTSVSVMTAFPARSPPGSAHNLSVPVQHVLVRTVHDRRDDEDAQVVLEPIEGEAENTLRVVEVRANGLRVGGSLLSSEVLVEDHLLAFAADVSLGLVLKAALLDGATPALKGGAGGLGGLIPHRDGPAQHRGD